MGRLWRSVGVPSVGASAQRPCGWIYSAFLNEFVYLILCAGVVVPHRQHQRAAASMITNSEYRRNVFFLNIWMKEGSEENETSRCLDVFPFVCVAARSCTPSQSHDISFLVVSLSSFHWWKLLQFKLMKTRRRAEDDEEVTLATFPAPRSLIGVGKLDQPTSDAVTFNYQTKRCLRLLLPRHPTEAN